MTQNPKQTLALAIAVFAMTLVGFSANVVGNPIDPWGLSDKFRDHELQAMDPVLTREDLRDGSITFVLFGTSYPLVVAPAPWDPNYGAARLSTDGSMEIYKGTFENVAYLGQIDGDPTSKALVSVTSSGVAGHISTVTEDLYLEPLALIKPGAPERVSVVYRTTDVIVPAATNHVDIVVPGDPGSVPVPDGLVESHSGPGPSRTMTVWIDKNFVDTYGATTWINKATNVWNNLVSNFGATVTFSFALANGVFYYCDDQPCQDFWMGGSITAASTLLSTWANKVNGNGFVTYEIAHLFTGKELDGGTIGVAWQPGRYGLSQMVDAGGTYDGGASDYEAGILSSHESGHGFNGRHERATSYSHDHGFNHVHTVNHCHLFVPLTTICLINHEHQENHWHADPYTHYTIMWPSFSHEPSSKIEQLVEFSGTNVGQMQDCNANSWSGGSFSPGSGTGWGSYCTS